MIPYKSYNDESTMVSTELHWFMIYQTCMYIIVYMYIHKYIHVHTYIYKYIYIYIHIHICIDKFHYVHLRLPVQTVQTTSPSSGAGVVRRRSGRESLLVDLGVSSWGDLGGVNEKTLGKHT